MINFKVGGKREVVFNSILNKLRNTPAPELEQIVNNLSPLEENWRLKVNEALSYGTLLAGMDSIYTLIEGRTTPLTYTLLASSALLLVYSAHMIFLDKNIFEVYRCSQGRKILRTMS